MTGIPDEIAEGKGQKNAVIRHSGIVYSRAPLPRGTATGTVSVRLFMFPTTDCRGCVQNPQFLKNKEFSSPASPDIQHRRRVHARNCRDLQETSLLRKVAGEEDVRLSFHPKRVSQGLQKIYWLTKMPMCRSKTHVPILHKTNRLFDVRLPETEHKNLMNHPQESAESLHRRGYLTPPNSYFSTAVFIIRMGMNGVFETLVLGHCGWCSSKNLTG